MEEKDEIWELAEKIYVQMIGKMDKQNITNSIMVKNSQTMAKEFILQKYLDLDKDE